MYSVIRENNAHTLSIYILLICMYYAADMIGSQIIFFGLFFLIVPVGQSTFSVPNYIF
jgi:hypothetical protein